MGAWYGRSSFKESGDYKTNNNSIKLSTATIAAGKAPTVQRKLTIWPTVRKFECVRTADSVRSIAANSLIETHTSIIGIMKDGGSLYGALYMPKSVDKVDKDGAGLSETMEMGVGFSALRGLDDDGPQAWYRSRKAAACKAN